MFIQYNIIRGILSGSQKLHPIDISLFSKAALCGFFCGGHLKTTVFWSIVCHCCEHATSPKSVSKRKFYVFWKHLSRTYDCWGVLFFYDFKFSKFNFPPLTFLRKDWVRQPNQPRKKIGFMLNTFTHNMYLKPSCLLLVQEKRVRMPLAHRYDPDTLRAIRLAEKQGTTRVKVDIPVSVFTLAIPG